MQLCNWSWLEMLICIKLIGWSYRSFLCCDQAFPVERHRIEENGLSDDKRAISFCWWGVITWYDFISYHLCMYKVTGTDFWYISGNKVIIVTSSLMKDMNSKTDMYRANAIRVLCRITDGTLLTQIERYLKQAIVDKNPVVASAALVSGIHLLQVLYNIHPNQSTRIICWSTLSPYVPLLTD